MQTWFLVSLLLTLFASVGLCGPDVSCGPTLICTDEPCLSSVVSTLTTTYYTTLLIVSTSYYVPVSTTYYCERPILTPIHTPIHTPVCEKCGDLCC